MKFYLSSFRIGNEGEKLKELVPNKRILYIPNALDFPDVVEEDRKKHQDESIQSLEKLGLEPELLDLRDYFGKETELAIKLNEIKAVWINGGNTYILRQAMKLSGFDNYIKSHLSDKEFLYGGFSAGICVLAPSLDGIQQVDNPSQLPYPQLQEVIWEGLGILDYLILPHYKSNHPESEDIDKEVEYCKKNNIAFKTLKDGEVIITSIS